jgi:hypothetical protein
VQVEGAKIALRRHIQLERQVEALVAAVLVRLFGLDAIEADAKSQPGCVSGTTRLR